MDINNEYKIPPSQDSFLQAGWELLEGHHQHGWQPKVQVSQTENETLSNLELSKVELLTRSYYLSTITICLLDRYYHYSAHSVADCMEDVTLLESTWQEEKNRDEIIEEEDQTEEKDDLDVKDEL